MSNGAATLSANGTPKLSTGFALPFSGDELLHTFDFINLKNGSTQITAEKHLGDGGGATSLAAGNVKLFASGANGQAGTVSFQGGGQKYAYSSVTGDNTTVKIGPGGGITVAPQKSIVGGLNQTQLLLIGGAVAVGVLLFVLVKRKSNG